MNQTGLDPLTRSQVAKDLDELANEFEGTFGVETIERYVAESLDQLSGSKVQSFLPIFVRRFARDRLRALRFPLWRAARAQASRQEPS